MRSTQFDEHFPLGEEPEEHRGRNQPDTLCETLKHLGYSQNNQVRLYGEVFDLVSDPVAVGDNFVFVDALERKSGQVRRVRIPPTIVQIARVKRRAA
jgi:hypothetical protein